MRNDAPIVLAEWAGRVNRETRATMGVSIGPELSEYSPPPDKIHRARREARAYLTDLMSDEQAAACAAADLERVRAIREHPDDEYEGSPSTFAAACRAADAEFLVKQKDPARLRSWLARRSAIEREEILRHLEQHKKGGGGKWGK
jgi:hypothetical protein